MTAPQVPPWVRGNSVDVSPASNSPTGSPNWNDRGTADGNSVQPDSDFGMSSCNFECNLSASCDFIHCAHRRISYMKFIMPKDSS